MKPFHDPIEALVNHVVRCKAADIPTNVIAFQKRRVLDNIAASLAGVGSRGTTDLLDMYAAYGAIGGCTLVGSDLRLPAALAAQVNATQARALDFCDVVKCGYHPSSTDIPVAIAAAEMVGATGSEMLNALALGQDVALRINDAAFAISRGYNGFDGNVVGVFASTAIVGRLLKLNETQLWNAFGLALNSASGSFQANQDKTLSVRLIQGQIARAGLEAAFLAARGVTGIRRVLGGECGFFSLYVRGQPDLSILMSDLGSSFRGEEQTCFKPYPCCSLLLSVADAGISIRLANGFEPESISKLAIELSTVQNRICGQQFEPGEDPEVAAMFSAQYVLATSLLRGRPRLVDFSSEVVLEPAAMDLAKKTEIWGPVGNERDRCRVAITWSNGTQFEKVFEFGLGWPENPIGRVDLEAKFDDCISFSKACFPVGRAGEIMASVDSLDQATSITGLTRLLTHSPS